MLGEKIKVLIVDDDTSYSKIMKQMLESKSCTVKTAQNQKTALSLLLNETFHIAFIDCILVSGHGIELVKKIREALGYSLDIVMMSGIVNKNSFYNYRDIGFSNFLKKPIQDKKIELYLNNIKEQIRYGDHQSIYTRFFCVNYKNIDKLKRIISTKKIKGFNFFLFLSAILSSKESLSIDFNINDTKHTILCNKGHIVDYQTENTEYFLSKFLEKNTLKKQEIEPLKNMSVTESVENLLNTCTLSSGQISDVKYHLCIETLRSITTDLEFDVNIDLITPKKISFLLFDQKDLTDFILLLVTQNFTNPTFTFLNKKDMNKSLIFNKNIPKPLTEGVELIEDLKSGMKLQSFYNKHFKDPNAFSNYILYLLLNEQVKLSSSHGQMKYMTLYERYEKLHKFISHNNPKTVFLQFSSLPENTQMIPSEIKAIYLNLLKFNHPDKFSDDLPEDLLDSINLFCTKMKNICDVLSCPNKKTQDNKKKREDKIQEEVLNVENIKFCKRFLQEKNYTKTLSIIKSVPLELIETDETWQLLYLWLFFEDKENTYDKKKVHQYMKNIQAKAQLLSRDSLYKYVLGLFYEDKNRDSKALMCFQQAKDLKPSFSPVYPAIKRCSLNILKNRQKNQNITSKFLKIFKDFKSHNINKAS